MSPELEVAGAEEAATAAGVAAASLTFRGAAEAAEAAVVDGALDGIAVLSGAFNEGTVVTGELTTVEPIPVEAPIISPWSAV